MKRYLLIIVLIFICSNSGLKYLFCEGFPSVFLDDRIVREYIIQVFPFIEDYVYGDNVEKIRVSLVENKMNQKTHKDGDSIYEYNNQGRIVKYYTISDSIVGMEYTFVYSEDGFLESRVEKQYLNDQLYKEKNISVLRLKDSNNRIQIIERELKKDKTISNENISLLDYSIEYRYVKGLKIAIDKYCFNKELKIVEMSNAIKYYNDNDLFQFSLFKFIYNSNGLLSSCFEYDENNLLITKYYFTYEEGVLISAIIKDNNDPSYEKVFNFNKYDENGNWTNMKEIVSENGIKQVEREYNRIFYYYRH